MRSGGSTYSRGIRGAAIAFAIAAVLSFAAAGQETTRTDYKEDHLLGYREKVDRRINKGEVHRYTVRLKHDDLLHISLNYTGVDVVLAIANRDGDRKVLKRSGIDGQISGTQNLIFVADADGVYLVGVFAVGTSAPDGSYSLLNSAPLASLVESLAAVAELRKAEKTAYDGGNFIRSIMLARKAIDLMKGLTPDATLAALYFGLGNGLYSNSQFEEAIDWYRKAIPLYRQFKNDADEGVALINIGGALSSLKRFSESNRAYDEALPIFVKTGNKLSHASTLLSMGENSRRLRDYSAAIAHIEKAAAIYASLKQPIDGATAHSLVAGIYFEQAAFEKAAEGFRRAAAIFRNSKDAPNEALMLSNVGLAYAKLERIGESRQILNEALKLIAVSPSPRVETAIRQVLGEAYFAAGSTVEALAQYQLSLAASRLAGDPLLEIGSLRGVGTAHSDLGDYQSALKHHLEALAIAERIKNETEQAIDLGNIALVYSELGKYDRTFEYDLKALDIYTRLKDKRGERVILNNIGIAYLRLGSLLKAQDYIERAAALSRELKDEREMAMMLGNLAAVYTRLKKFDKAIIYFEESMPLFRKYNNHRFAVIIGYYYGTLRRERGEIAKAIKLHTDAVELARMARTPKYEARALIELGLDHLAQRKTALAAVNFKEALIVARSVEAREEESVALAGLMESEIQNRNTELAVFYGKQSINLLQTIRSEIVKVEKDIQANYVKDNEHTYRQLADTLIAEGRLPEAQQVLGMLKEEEMSGFVRRDSKEIENLAKRADLRANERAALEKYSAFSSRVTGLAAELAKLDEKKRGVAPGETFADQVRYDELSIQIKNANTAFRLFLEKELAAELGSERKREIDADRALQGKLKEWGEGTVAIATMIGDQRYRVILTTPKVQIDGKTDITSADLNRKIFAFREALLDPNVDPRPLGKQLYDVLIKPIEKDLVASGAKTLLWSLDGTLRYIPVAALWDGEGYLVEKFQNVVVTSTTRQSLQSNVVGQWNVLGAGVTKASQVTDASTSQKIAFDELLGVGKELTAIISGPLTEKDKQPRGFSLLDAAFTEQALKQQLTQTVANKRRFNVLHFATHFRLGTDTSDSFLLLGNNAALTLADVADSPEMDLTDIELVTLSACNTGYGGIESNKTLAENNGKEVDSLAQFIELRGAKSVMATLWAVVDESTALLMGDFYRLREANPDWTKSEALRKAQLALLSGEKKGVPIARKRRSDPIDMGDSAPKQPAFVKDPSKPFAHPHYWAPFVMIGNWR